MQRVRTVEFTYRRVKRVRGKKSERMRTEEGTHSKIDIET